MLIDLAKAADSEDDYPPSLKNRPKPTPWQQGFMDAFNVLNSSRTYTSVSAAAIPYPVLLAWLDEHRIFDLSDREEFVSILQAIDNTYLSVITKPTSKTGDDNG